jgi:hypothetical protein
MKSEKTVFSDFSSIPLDFLEKQFFEIPSITYYFYITLG